MIVALIAIATTIAVVALRFTSWSHMDNETRLALLTIVYDLHGTGYGVTIRQAYVERLERDVSFGRLYAYLDRLETEGLLTSWPVPGGAERGFRNKRLFRVRADGEMEMRRLTESRRD